MAGCAPQRRVRPTLRTAHATREVALRLLVVDDPELSVAIGKISGEWKARSGASLTLSDTTSAELLAATAPPAADAVIYPSALLGTLAERGWLAPLPADFATHRELAWSDAFELLQTAECVWGQQTYAVPLGSPVLTCYYRPDLLEKHHKQPPRTWLEYQELAEFFSKRENLGDAAPPADAPWHGCLEPLAKGWGGALLLARAAAYARHRDQYSTLFHIDTMAPLVSGPPFVRALEDLVAAAKLGPENKLDLTITEVRKRFLAGHAALAIAWPGHLANSGSAAENAPVAFAELPGAEAVYNVGVRAWEDRAADEAPQVPLLGTAGRLGSIGGEANYSQDALRLLAWLSSHEWGPKVGAVSSASAATTLYRTSQIAKPDAWLDAGTSAVAAEQYATSVRNALSRQAYLFVPRIPGHDRYMAALDNAVIEAVSGRLKPHEALAGAASQWQKIVAELGTAAERKAYRQSLGIEP